MLKRVYTKPAKLGDSYVEMTGSGVRIFLCLHRTKSSAMKWWGLTVSRLAAPVEVSSDVSQMTVKTMSRAVVMKFGLLMLAITNISSFIVFERTISNRSSFTAAILTSCKKYRYGREVVSEHFSIDRSIMPPCTDLCRSTLTGWVWASFSPRRARACEYPLCK